MFLNNLSLVKIEIALSQRGNTINRTKQLVSNIRFPFIDMGSFFCISNELGDITPIILSPIIIYAYLR